MTYFDEINKAMKMLSKNKKTVVMGQSVAYKGTGLFWTLKETWSKERRIELPVFEDVQMGMSIGMALDGMIPVSIYPRWDFLLLAANQLVNHLDKMEEMSDGQFKPKVIIRTAVGSQKPLFPGPQHIQDHTGAFSMMLKRVNIITLTDKNMIMDAYKQALESEGSTILVEYPDLYKT